LVADDRPFIRVHEGMPDHPKVESLSDRAFRFLVETWCWCARHRNDGLIKTSAWAKRGTPRLRRELIEAGLVEQHENGVEVHDFLDWQRSAAEIADAVAQKRNAGGLGNHVRWHVAAKRIDPNCPHCSQERSHPRSHPAWQPGSQVRSHPGSRNDREPIAETETEPEKQGVTSRREVTTRAREATPPNGNLATTRPDERCARHRDHLGPVPPCGACADARKSAATWDELQRTVIRACPLCDVEGWRYEPGRRIPITPYQRCDHTDTEAQRA
jgi:hypothetical protein